VLFSHPNDRFWLCKNVRWGQNAAGCPMCGLCLGRAKVGLTRRETVISVSEAGGTGNFFRDAEESSAPRPLAFWSPARVDEGHHPPTTHLMPRMAHHPRPSVLPRPRIGCFRRFGAVTLVAVGVVACDDPAGTASSGRGEVTGTVAQAKTGDGVGDLVIALTQGGHVVATTATGPEGGFGFDGLSAGTYELNLTGIELTRLSPLHTSLEPRRQTVTVGAGSEPLLFAAVGIVPARISGVVTCGGVEQTAASIRIVGGAVDTMVSTDGIGRYALTDLEAGHYTLIPAVAPCIDSLPVEVTEAEVGQFVRVDFSG
jgi:hypothetical protein